MPEPEEDERPAPSWFATTHWSIVQSAGRSESAESRQALAALCGVYWYPLYAYVRREGHSAHDAQELTQEFFTRLLEQNFLGRVDPQRGRFRSFLLAAMRNFLSNERKRARAKKRGGGRALIALDGQSAERRYQLEPADAMTPERLFERRWALALLDRVLRRMAEEFEVAGKAAEFENLKQYLTTGAAQASYRQLAEELSTTEGAVKTAVHRLRRRYRRILREEIAQTVAGPDEVEQELRELFAALGRENP